MTNVVEFKTFKVSCKEDVIECIEKFEDLEGLALVMFDKEKNLLTHYFFTESSDIFTMIGGLDVIKSKLVDRLRFGGEE